MRPLAAVLGGAALVAGVVACKHESAQQGAVTFTGASEVSNEEAIERVTGARCERDRACNEVGQGRRWATLDACLSELDRDTRASLNTEECPNGINEQDLASCVNEIQHERCGNPIDTIGRVVACRKGKICR